MPLACGRSTQCVITLICSREVSSSLHVQQQFSCLELAEVGFVPELCATLLAKVRGARDARSDLESLAATWQNTY